MSKFKYGWPVVAVDFDGVLHAYSQGWRDGDIYDPPVPGARERMEQLVDDGYKLVVLTAREDLQAVKDWLVAHRMDHLFRDVTNVKMPAVAYIDDRACAFSGDWTATEAAVHALHLTKKVRQRREQEQMQLPVAA